MSPAVVTSLEARPTEIEGLLVIRTKHVDDERGTVREMFREGAISELSAGRLKRVRQVNLTYSRRGCIRGLHGEAMVKLVGVATGSALGAYVDTRTSSPTAGTLVTVDLGPGTQVLVPAGVCNGFQSTSEDGCLYLYCFDEEWEAGMPSVGVNPLDPYLKVPWPLDIDPGDSSLVSVKDAGLPPLSEVLGRPEA